MSNPAPISANSFPAFFRALWSYDPFPWQIEFAARLCAGSPPDFVTVPTGSGKTACLDGAIFALAVQASRTPAERAVGRRIFFIVNRRIIVDEAYDRASKHLLPALRDPEEYLAKRESAKPEGERLSNSQIAEATAVLGQVAWWLRQLAGGEDTEPLGCAELRGGIYRDRAWAKSLIQPMILCSTVDQAGSRLLFRGYGVSPEARPVHAALVAQDCLLLLDEAHISTPFVETLNWVKRYRSFQPPNTQTLALPFSLICLTATPPNNVPTENKLGLSDADLEHPVLKLRLTSAKQARLVAASKAKGKMWNDELAKVLEAQASALIEVEERAPRSLAIMVNRVATARAVYSLIQKSQPTATVDLLLGRMRPLDRDTVAERLGTVLKTTRPGETVSEEHPRQIVVSTQCLEVGADYDFDALITECASLDALRQRFGRLNRGGRPITAHAIIVLPEEQNIALAKLDEVAPIDPIYGNAIPRTWAWLQSLPDGADFGLAAMASSIDRLRATDEGEKQLGTMLTPVRQAPVLLPAYLDCWVQTNPTPAADPEIALFLHGPQRDMAEVQVCWRADLPDKTDDERPWIETLALCPPTTLECLPVPLHLMRQWLENGGKLATADNSGDVPQDIPEAEKNRSALIQPPRVLIWRGAKARHVGANEASQFVDKARDVRPGDTLILRTQDGGWQTLGHLPEAPTDALAPTASMDIAERGQAQMRRRVFVRVHPAVWPDGERGSPAWQLSEWAKNPEFDWRTSEASEMLIAVAETIEDCVRNPFSLAARLRHLAKWTLRKRGRSGLEVESYPGSVGIVLSVRERLPPSAAAADDSISDDAQDDPLLETAAAQSLEAHTQQVKEIAKSFSRALGLVGFDDVLSQSAELHDWGKVDPRFQALLIGGDIPTALAQKVLWAKSASIPTSAMARQTARLRAELPEGFRHEMLSVQLAENFLGRSELLKDETLQALVLHLIATHHGYARPFAPVVQDETPPDVSLPTQNGPTFLTGAERAAPPAHALDSGLAERFWLMNRHYGWWGIALLEAVLRIADQTASATPQFYSANEP